MDIGMEKNIEYGKLKAFFELAFPSLNFFLVYEGVNDWEDVVKGKTVIQYFEDKEVESGFRYGLNILIKDDGALLLIENISLKLSNKFGCRTICDASRHVKERNVYYSLLFEQGKVYLVDDILEEETGDIAKVVELNYEPPEYDFD